MLKGVSRLLLAAALFASGSCGKPSGDDPNTLIINNSTEPKTLDPALETSQPDYRVTIGLFEGLATYDPKDLTVKPGVAESWELSEGGRVYTFHLRESRWSNGDPVTADDFEWSWKRVLNPVLASEYVKQVANYLKNGNDFFSGASADLILKLWAETASAQRAKDAERLEQLAQKRHVDTLRRLATEEKDKALAVLLQRASEAAFKRGDVRSEAVGVRAQGDRTLIVTLESATPYFLDLAAFFTYFPVHRKTVETYGDNWTRPEHIVSNGPFKLREWKPKNYILLEKNAHYWDAANVSDLKLKLLPIESGSTAFNLYEKGRIHWLSDVPREYIEELLTRPDYHTGPMLTTYFYAFNLDRNLTKNVKVRQALAGAINKEKIVKYVSQAGEVIATSLVPPGLSGYTPASMASYNPAAARTLLAEAGYPDGKGFPKFELLYNTQEGHRKVASAIQEMWRNELHIEVSLRNVEFKILLEMQKNMEFDVIRRAWIADYNDPNTFLDMFMTTNGQNNTGWSNVAYDRLVDAASRELDSAKRMKLLHDAEAILMEELPIIPIYFYVTKNMWKPEVTGIYDNVRDTHPYNRLRLAEKPR